MCDICNNESGGQDVGVASLTSGPMSVMFCRECLNHYAEPTFALEYLYIHVAGGDITQLHESVKLMHTWIDGKYESFEEYVKRITPEQVKKELEEYEAMRDNNGPSREN